MIYALVSIGRKPGGIAWKDSGTKQVKTLISVTFPLLLMKYELVSTVEMQESVFTGATLSDGCQD